MNQTYKNTSSLITWVLHNNIVDAYTIWMLAQGYDRHKNGHATGRIKSKYFIKYLANTMLVTEKTAKTRLNKAIKNEFIERPASNTYIIRSHRYMTIHAMDDQQQRHDEKQTTISPQQMLQADREYTRKLFDWIDPKNIINTKTLLTGIVCIQGSVRNIGKITQGKLINSSRRTVQRRALDPRLNTIERHVAFDVHSMLTGADCSPSVSASAFKEAEDIYRKRNGQCSLPGRKLLHSKYIPSKNKSLLIIQVPNAHFSSLNIREVPANRERCKWLRSRVGVGACCLSMSPRHTNRPSKSSWLGERFTVSEKIGVSQKNNALFAVCQKYLIDILECGACREHILDRTGASGLGQIQAAVPALLSGRLFKTDTPKPPLVRNGSFLTSSFSSN